MALQYYKLLRVVFVVILRLILYLVCTSRLFRPLFGVVEPLDRHAQHTRVFGGYLYEQPLPATVIAPHLKRYAFNGFLSADRSPYYMLGDALDAIYMRKIAVPLL